MAGKGVSTTHPEYDEMLPTWQKCRDCEKGQKAVHKAGVLYLPELKDQTTDDYDAYKLRATFFNAFYRTISGLKGTMFRVEPQTEAPTAVSDLFHDITASGIGLSTFGQILADEVLTVGRVGVLTDHPQSPDGATKADAAKLNLRPTLALYQVESIINWRTGRVNNATVLTLVVLREEKVEIDGFNEKKTKQFRVLDLTEQGYRQRLFEVNDKGEDIQIGPEVYPKMGGKVMQEIPFVFFGPNETTPAVYDPPLIDLADLNLSHYRTTADLENGAHFTGLPMLFLSGIELDQGEKIYVGSQEAVVSRYPEADGKYIEFQGQGLGALEKVLDRKEQQMAIMGARMLEAPKKAAEAAETATILRMGEQSVLATIAGTLSRGMTQSLEWLALFLGAAGEVEFTINTDFLPQGMSPQMIREIRETWLAGGMSSQARFENYKKGQLYAEDATFEDEDARIREGGMVGGGEV